MNWHAIGEVCSAVGVIVALAALVYQVREVKNQIKISVFTNYTDRYSRSRRDMPNEAREASSPRSLDDLSASDRDRVLNAMRDYFNLCSEEFFLNNKGWIDKDAWSIWLKGMRSCTREPYFRASWEKLKHEYSDAYIEFCQFMQRDIIDRAGMPTDSWNRRGKL